MKNETDVELMKETTTKPKGIIARIFSILQILVVGILIGASVYHFKVHKPATTELESQIVMMKSEAVNRGGAYYDPRTGDFMWAGYRKPVKVYEDGYVVFPDPDEPNLITRWKRNVQDMIRPDKPSYFKEWKEGLIEWWNS